MMADNKTNKLHFVGYGFLILFAYIIQFTPMMIEVLGAYPMPLLMLTVIIAMFERDLTAGIFGLICGMLTDINMVNGSGLHAIVYMFTAVIISLLIETLLQNNVLSLLLISAVTFFANSLVELFTKSVLTSGILTLYTATYLRSAVYSFIAIIPLYLLFALIFGHALKYKPPQGIIPSKLKKYRKNNKNIYRRKGY